MLTEMTTALLKYTMSPGDVAELLGVTGERVRQLDDVLQPIRRRNNYRRYDPERVLRYAESRKVRP